jgi:serine/threonine-protein kinase
MNDQETVKLLALLVHRGMLDAATAQRALESGDAGDFLVGSGAVDAATWSEWVSTRAGTRPVLTRYELREQIGEGGEARVFRAVDRVTGDLVALKVMRPERSESPVALRRFVAEAKLLIELEHENIVKGLRVAREGATVFFAMELVDGTCALDRLSASGPLGEDEALDVVRQVAHGLAHLHARGLVHRDVKPGNILLDGDGRAVLIDLGFAVGRDDDGAPADSTAGTVHYISPEQARGEADLDVRADIYSLGATLYHLLTGSLPFSGNTSEEVMRKQVLESLSGERIRSMNLSPQVHYLIEKMMAKEKEIRFQDPAQLIGEIDAWLAQRAHEASLGEERPAALKRRQLPNRRRRKRS